MCNAALQPACDRRGDERKKHQDSKRVMFGCQSALVSPQSRRSHLKSVAVPVFARLPHGNERGRVRASLTNECRTGVWFFSWVGAGVGGVAFECQCCWGI